MNKRLIAIPVGALAAALAVGSVAHACTVVTGQTTILSPSGGSINVTSNRAVTASASGVPNDVLFYMTFLNRISDQDSMGTCMASTTALHQEQRMWDSPSGTTATPVRSSNGSIPPTTRYIPSDVHPFPDVINNHSPHNGTGSICWLDEKGYYVTNDQTIILTGGSA